MIDDPASVRPTRRTSKKFTPRSRRTRLTRAATSPRGRSSATRTCTRRSRWTRARSARGSRPAMPTGSHGERRSPPIPVSRSSCPGRSTSSSWRTTRTASGSFPQLMSGDPELLATPQGRKWYDQIKGGKGAEAAIDIIRASARTNCPRGSRSRARAPIARPGRRSSRLRKPTTIRAGSRPSSGSNGPRTRAATTCTAMSSSARTARRRASSNPTPR